jgi:hypothetical protein
MTDAQARRIARIIAIVVWAIMAWLVVVQIARLLT